MNDLGTHLSLGNPNINEVQYYTQHSSKSESSGQLLLVEIWSPHEIRQGRGCLTSLTSWKTAMWYPFIDERPSTSVQM